MVAGNAEETEEGEAEEEDAENKEAEPDALTSGKFFIVTLVFLYEDI